MDTALALAMLVVFVPDPPLSRIGTACGAARPGPSAAATMTLRGLKTFVKRTFGERAAGAMFTAELTSRTAAITCRLRELRAVDAEALARYDALRDDLEDLETRVAIIFGTAPQRIVRSTGLPDDWRRRASEALRHSTRLECFDRGIAHLRRCLAVRWQRGRAEASDVRQDRPGLDRAVGHGERPPLTSAPQLSCTLSVSS